MIESVMESVNRKNCK